MGKKLSVSQIFLTNTGGKKMRDKVKAVLENAYPDIDFEGSDELVDKGVLDSITIVGIVSELSMEFGIEIPYEEIIPDNFNSLDGLTKLVEKYQ